MFSEKHYVPIIKWKKGEQTALETIPQVLKSSFTPLIEIVPPTYDFDKKVYKKTIDEHLANIAVSLGKSWSADIPFFIDLKWIPLSLQNCLHMHALEFILQESRSIGFKAIPVTGSNRDLAYQNTVKKAITKDKLGICFRIEDHDFVHLEDNLKSMLTFFSVKPSEVDLVIDYGAISDKDNSKNYISIIGLIKILPFIEQWRSLTFCASAFPEDTSLISRNTVGSYQRSEWSIWNALYSNKANFQRIPTFGDYAIANPNFKEVDPRIMTMSANIRYTADKKWIVIKGMAIKRNGWDQVRGMCKKLLTLEEFSGPSFSWGDKYIFDCANEIGTCGNATTWRKVGTNHHIIYVVNQLSNLL